MLLPASKANIKDIWHVMGLKGTGSNQFEIGDLFVPEAFSYFRDDPANRHEPGRLYGLLQTTFFGMTFAGVALGIARTALDDFITLAASKKPAHSTMVMGENPAVQREVALAEANLGAARAYLIERINTLWESGDAPESWPVEGRARLRLACTHATLQAREAVAFAYQAAGSTAIFEINPFERRFRDVNTVANQSQGQPTNLEQAGMALLGVNKKGSRI
jgi:alkylation response protein AidB-like acyl-CoA dehydrogenase